MCIYAELYTIATRPLLKKKIVLKYLFIIIIMLTTCGNVFRCRGIFYNIIIYLYRTWQVHAQTPRRSTRDDFRVRKLIIVIILPQHNRYMVSYLFKSDSLHEAVVK